MFEQLTRNWRILAIRGAAGVLFGVAALVWPGLTLAVLVALFGAYALVDGVFAAVAAIRYRRQYGRWWALLLEGVLGIVAGLVAVLLPGLTAAVLVYLIAGWAVATGVFEIVAAVRLRQEIEGEWLLALSGVASVLLGVLLIVRPGPGALALVWLIGSYAIVFGALLLVLAFRLRGLGHGAPWQRAPA
jgi:uncharacterized membrane protein HdeD (DUF308 family)